jgi:beta-lactamase superfamily II metal-dependent hydrolase
MRLCVGFLGAVLALAVSASAARTLDIYFIDVEGGQSTLIVTPSGESLLIDTGYPELNGRDPDRIMAAVSDAHISRIDYLLITHFHEDHDGGAAELARRLPVRTYIDYGSPKETGPDVVAAFAAYEAARRGGRHIVPNPGDRLPIKDVDVEVVSAGGAKLSRPLRGAGEPNPACGAYERRADITTENPRSIGVRLRYGAFRFLDLGDLGWNALGELVCPSNLIGEIDVYLAAHHGNGDAAVPALVDALRPRVAIVNNGVVKGGTATGLSVLRNAPGLEDIWQLHRTINNGAENVPDAFIANLEGDERDLAAWIKLSATADGRFTVGNGRTGWSKTYARR